MVVAFKGVAVCESRGLLQGYATATVTTHSILVLDGHDLLREVALVHIEIETVHGNQFGESDVVGLSLVIRQSVAEHEHAFLGGMGVEVDVHLQVLVLVRVLADGFLGCPDGWLVAPVRLIVESVQVLAQGVESVVSASNAIWIKRRYHFEYIVFSQESALLALQVSDHV